jgi:TM2 domain-containing membrane protein YozV
MQPDPSQAPAMQDSVVGGNVHTGNVVHNHYHAAPQPVVQQVPVQAVVQQTYAPAATYIPPTGSKDVVVAYLMWFFLGLIGGHRFYLGHVGMGILYLFTFGGFGIGWVIDALIMPQLVHQANNPNQVIIIR